jgi:hypothetical protein
LEVRKGVPEHGKVVLGAFGAGTLSGKGIVIDVVSSEELVCYVEVSLVETLLKPTAGEGLVLFGRHRAPPFPAFRKRATLSHTDMMPPTEAGRISQTGRSSDDYSGAGISMARSRRLSNFWCRIGGCTKNKHTRQVLVQGQERKEKPEDILAVDCLG